MNLNKRVHASSLLLIIAVFCSLSVQAQRLHTDKQETEESWVLLSSGEYIYGEVDTPTVRRAPSHVTINNERHAQHSILGFRHEGQDYYVLHSSMASPRAILLRQVSNGRVSLLAEASSEGPAEFFRTQDGEIASLSNRDLMRALGDHPEALRHLQADRRYGTISVLSLVAGAAAVGVGASMEWGVLPNSGSTGLIVAVSGVALAAGVNAIVPMLRRSSKMRAIDAYNEGY